LRIPPEEAAMVGDSLRADIQGAKMLNMLAIWKPKASLREEDKVAWKPSQDEIMPDIIIENLKDLLEIF
jgi:FMN phosphatase YigB (HAD superfamily)